MDLNQFSTSGNNQISPSSGFGEQPSDRLSLENTVCQVEWLLIAVILFFLFLPGATIVNRQLVVGAIVVFTFLVAILHYTALRRVLSFGKTFFELVLMFTVVSVVVWQTGLLESPLLSLYFLVIIVAASTVGLKTTLLLAGAVSIAYFFMASLAVSSGLLTGGDVRLRLLQLFPLWLVAYLAALFASEAENRRQQLSRMAHTDSLTELWNMRMFTSFAEQEFARAQRYQRSFAIIMFDADNLKKVNDSFGHQVGSSMIRLMGRLLRDNLRASDVVARYGGDEFIAMLPETTAEKAYLTAERVRLRLAENGFSPPGSCDRTVELRSSAGIAVFPLHDQDLAGIIRKADAALYHSKRQGKNQVSVFGEFEPD